MSLNKVPHPEEHQALVSRQHNGVVESSRQPQRFRRRRCQPHGSVHDANKWNRQVLYKASFKRFYDEMKKQAWCPAL